MLKVRVCFVVGVLSGCSATPDPIGISAEPEPGVECYATVCETPAHPGYECLEIWLPEESAEQLTLSADTPAVARVWPGVGTVSVGRVYECRLAKSREMR